MGVTSAFPHDEYHDEKRVGQWPGMTLRDYFAAAALTGELAASVHAAVAPEEVARRAWATADAMISQRQALRSCGAPRLKTGRARPAFED